MYGKIFSSMYDGTLASRGPWQALVTFQQMIVLADQDGVVDMTADAIARRTSIPLEIIEAGIEALLQPDTKSRTPDEEGRRIVTLEEHRDWGWQIVNHAKYRDMRKAEDRREYLRVAQANRREKLKSTSVNKRQQMSAKINTSTNTDADADTEADALRPSVVVVSKSPRPGKKAPESFTLTDDMRAWAIEKVPGVNVEAETDKLKDYTFSRAISDWNGAWRNWMRKAHQDASKSVKSNRSQYTPSAAERRVLQACPGLAAPHLRPHTIDQDFMELTDVTPRQLDR